MAANQSNLSASSSSSPNPSLSDTEDDHTIARILADDDKLANVKHLGRRLSHLDSILHTPRVIKDIPNADDATLDHNRLAERSRLTAYSLAELQIVGDGNCQFRALADQLFHNPDYHQHVRKQVVKQLKNCRNLYESYVPMKYGDYLKKMKRSGEWGDHVTLQAAADRVVSEVSKDLLTSQAHSNFPYDHVLPIYHGPIHRGIALLLTSYASRDFYGISTFGAKICLVTSFRDTCYIEILPYDKNFSKEIWLSFWSEVHYNSLYDSGDVPTRLPRKLHWPF